MIHPFSGKEMKDKTPIEHLEAIVSAVRVGIDSGFLSNDDVEPIAMSYLSAVSLNKCAHSPEDVYEYLLNCVDFTKDKKDSFVYVMQCTDGTVKIGKSDNPEKRCASVASISGKIIKETYFHKVESSSIAHAIEKQCHKSLSDRLISGEWFDISFKLAKERVFSYADAVKLPRLN